MAREGEIRFCGDSWSIVVPLEPFSSDDQYSTDWRPGTGGPHVVSTEVILDGIELPATEIGDLAGETFTFPRNPEDGYIDGSVYVGATHNPVDVTEIQFGRPAKGGIPAALTCDFVFEFELAGVPNQFMRLETMLRYR